jgi:demethylmacrocin O-methyltransferase
MRPTLTDLAILHQTDKWGHHRYTPHYEERLKHLRDKTFTLLELGIGGFTKEASGGNSLRMWRDYFPKATILGLDIIDKSHVAGDRIEVYTGDQTDTALLQRIADEHPDLRVVVDDGSHVSEHVRGSFAALFPLLPDGGVYAIEDTQTSYWPDWGGQLDPRADGTTMALVKELVDGLNYEEFLLEGYEPTYTDQHVRAIHCWHNLVIIEKGSNEEGTNRDRIHDRPYRL